MSELEDFLSKTAQPVVVHAMAATAPVCGERETGEAAAMLENIGFCTNFCPWLDEDWSAALDASTALDEPSPVNVEKTTGSHMETISFCSDFCPWLDEVWTVASDAGAVPHEMPDEISPPQNIAEKDTTEIQTGGSRRSKIHAYFKRVWKAIKKSFLCCRRRRVEPQTPQGNPHTNDPDLETDSDPEPVHRLSGCQKTVDRNPDPEPVPGPSGHRFTVDPVPDPEPVPGPSWRQITVDLVPDPEPVPRLSGCQNTVDLNPDPEPVPGPSGHRFTVDPVPDPEPVPEPSWRQITVDPVPDPEPVPRASGRQFTIDPGPDPEPVLGPSGVQDMADEESSSATGPNREILNSLYSFGDILGSGSYGVTYKAIRKSDGKEVAIKRIRIREVDRYISVPGYSKPVFKEAAFMLMLKNPPKSIYLIEMYEWFDQEGFISLVMEYPKPCIALRTFIYRRGNLKEPITRCLLHQLILAIQHSLEHGICHNDVHPDNILVNTDTLELKLIDFGCATMYKEEEHETVISGNIWILGYLLYFMVNGKDPGYSMDEKEQQLTFIPNLSSDCCDLIKKCLNKNLSTLEEVLQHEWMKKL